MRYTSSTVGSKWTKTKWLLERRDFQKHIPQTLLFNKRNLTTMLASHSVVYFKPTTGSGGVNIIRINKQSRGYQTQSNSVKADYPTLDQLFDNLKQYSARRPYLLQKGIALAKANGRPFDIRVMVQKTNEGKWVSTALFTKIGQPGKVATNYNQGGKLGYFRSTLSDAGYHEASIQRKEAKLKQLGVSVGHCFDRHSKGFRELGLDVALDSEGKPWILEVNTKPQIFPLKNLKDKGLYRRIVSFAEQYGRRK
ncbi:YheC/YheD family protein [Cohnella endophytica]|uniref:YheC/YheD family protein n=1 Tax=Cohnella endophytica TaxID=2419778 RepID=A0A494XP26_9BACL|nr:YheC/YheD family protein [Cohnella endophytica]RKP51481.1 YheC/YheD family protein [Cohnella endophytica]